jgi:ribokinase
VCDRGSARWAAELLLARGVRAAAIQAGTEGDVLVWQDRSLFLPKIDVNVIDITGAGDAFTAALAVALAEGRPFSEAGPFANAAAALATTEVGAQAGLPRREAVKGLLSRTNFQEASRAF